MLPPIFSSDHGPSHLLRGKTTPYEAGLRVPLIVRWPGRVEPGSITHQPGHLIDFMPTLLELAEVDHPEQFNGHKVRPMQGKSVLDLFQGKSPTAYDGASEVGYELFGMKAYFLGDWKILWMPKPYGLDDWELFNLKQDPAELNDLSNQHPEKLKEMIALWEKYKRENKVLDISIDLSGAE